MVPGQQANQEIHALLIYRYDAVFFGRLATHINLRVVVRRFTGYYSDVIQEVSQRAKLFPGNSGGRVLSSPGGDAAHADEASQRPSLPTSPDPVCRLPHP